MAPEDRVRLLHMIEAADEAMSFIAGHTPTGLQSDRKTLFAVIRCIEIIGEVAARVSDATRTSAQGPAELHGLDVFADNLAINGG